MPKGHAPALINQTAYSSKPNKPPPNILRFKLFNPPIPTYQLLQLKQQKMSNLRRALLFTLPRIINSSNRTSIATSTLPSHILYRPLAGTFSRFLYTNIDLSNEESKRRLYNRLIYRSKQRGYLELDLILGKWVEEHIQSMDENAIKSLVHVLDLENPDLWKWLTGQEQPPDAISTNPVFSAVREKVMNNLDKHASPDTRAVAGKPWVRGWDDFKKGRDAPIAGNQ